MTDQTTTPIEKLQLTREEHQELRIYFFIGERKVMDTGGFLPIPMPSSIERKCMYAIAYKLEEAFEITKKLDPGWSCFYTGQNTTVREFLEHLQIDQFVSPPKTEEPKLEEADPPKKISFEQFRLNLLLVADDYVKPEDRETLKRIISELQWDVKTTGK